MVWLCFLLRSGADSDEEKKKRFSEMKHKRSFIDLYNPEPKDVILRM